MPAYRLIIEGLVQGVGFRPFIHRIAHKTGVTGYVRNAGGSEVEVFIEGSSESIRKFIKAMWEEKPPPAIIEAVEIFEERPKGVKEFTILPSSKEKIKRSMIPPDFAVCEHCLREIKDPNNRRYRYAFNSCAWCGPRFSMMYRTPYDRENTSMSKYPLCPQCMQEYRDLRNVRRYHAQGISCPLDGPRLRLTDSEGEHVECEDPIEEAAKLIDEGHIVAVKGLGGYHIAALATDDEVVLRLRKRKNRPSKPFAVMGLDSRVLSKLVEINSLALKLFNSSERPIVLLPKKIDSPVSRYVSPGMDVEGVFTPYTPLHYLLLESTKDKFLIMTSGNPKGKPMCINEECAFSKLSSYVDYFLVHDRDIVNRVDDSVVRFTDGDLTLIRRGRGYAPRWLKVNVSLDKGVVAFGAELNNAGAVGFENKIVLTQYIGDVDDVETLMDLQKYIKFFIRNYGINLSKGVVVVDKHPLYLSRRLGMEIAENEGAELMEVQHHYAHALAVAADRRILGEPFLAIVMDGVGYGDDGNIWGGEVLYVHEDLTYERLAHLEYLPLVGDESVLRPARYLATSLLTRIPLEDVIQVLEESGAIKGLKGGVEEVELLSSALNAGRYVKSSSTGRALDAASALLGVCLSRTYEGEPAIKLEAFSRGGKIIYDVLDLFVPYLGEGEVLNVPVAEPLMYIAERIKSDSSTLKSLGATFQFGLGYGLASAAAEIHRKTGREFSKVVVGGGAAVNDYLVRGIRYALKGTGLEVMLPKEVPPNDGSIALGQVIASLRENN